jgi:hypothetical protein
MSLERVFAGLDAMERFARFTERLAVQSERPFIIGAEILSHKLHEHTTKVMGDSSKLRDLEDSTQADRVAKGYTANDPLVRDGKLLRDSIERTHFAEGTEAVAAIGSSEPVFHHMEYGFDNVRAGKFVEPRPAFEIGLAESLPDAEELIDIAIGTALGFSPSLTR